MKAPTRKHRALSIFAAALLAGCGGSQPPIGAPGAMPQALVRPDASRRLDYKATGPLVFVVNISNGNVTVYRALAKDPSPLATISEGLSLPGGGCIDGQGTLYVSNGTTQPRLGCGVPAW
jgi:hypothetical protein